MSSSHDVERIVRSWLVEDAHEDAGRVLDSVLEQLDTTPQRRPFWSVRRFATMSLFSRFAIAAVAVVAVAGIGLGVFNARQPDTGTKHSATPGPSSSTGVIGHLQSIDGTQLSVPFRLSAPLNYVGRLNGPDAYWIYSPTPSDGVHGLSVLVNPRLYRDPCRPDSGFLNPDVPPDAETFAADLKRLPDFHATSPVVETLAGSTWLQVNVTFTGDITQCQVPDELRMSKLRSDGANPVYDDWSGSLGNVVVDIGVMRGKLVVLESWAQRGQLPRFMDRELHSMMESLAFSSGT